MTRVRPYFMSRDQEEQKQARRQLKAELQRVIFNVRRVTMDMSKVHCVCGCETTYASSLESLS